MISAPFQDVESKEDILIVIGLRLIFLRMLVERAGLKRLNSAQRRTDYHIC
jgi:hypothetical protein